MPGHYPTYYRPAPQAPPRPSDPPADSPSPVNEVHLEQWKSYILGQAATSHPRLGGVEEGGGAARGAVPGSTGLRATGVAKLQPLGPCGRVQAVVVVDGFVRLTSGWVWSTGYCLRRTHPPDGWEGGSEAAKKFVYLKSASNLQPL